MNKRAYLLVPVGALLGAALGLLLWAKPPSSRVLAHAGLPTPAPALPGQSSTLLPDGRLLLLGGESAGGPAGTAAVKDPATGSTTALPNGLSHARAWHTATLLPDGTVLVLGGLGPDGHVVTAAELFDPASGKFAELATPGLIPRARHTVTLLTDGRVLVVGGMSDTGETLASAQLWDPRTGASTNPPSSLLTARHDHTATLEPDGTVLVWGGVDQNGLALNYGEIFDPATQTFQMQGSPPNQPAGQLLQVEATLPEDGAENVAVDVLMALRFSRSLQVQTVNESTLTLTGPGGAVPSKVVPAEAGMLAFLTPQSPLAAGITYTVTLAGAATPAGIFLGQFSFSFTTAGQPSSGPAAGIVGNSTSSSGGPQNSPWRNLPPLQAPPGVTALAGQVLQLSGQPLSGVTLQIGNTSTRSDGTGRFLLRNVSAGHQVLWIDARTANQGQAVYGTYEDGVDIAAGQTNALNYTIWMTQLDMADAVTIPSPTTSETVVTTPLIPGLELHIPPGTTITDHDGNVVTQVSITQIPVSQPPFPLPLGVPVPVYFTIQPGGAYLQNAAWTGARLIYPNLNHLLPGSSVNFWNYDADEKGWYVYGQGTVNPQGTQVIPNPGVAIYEFTGAMINSSKNPPGTHPTNETKAGEPVELSTGLFVYRKTDLFLQDTIPLNLARTYRPGDSNSYSFGIGTMSSYDMYLWSANQYQEADLILPDSSRVHFVRTSSGTGFLDAVFQSLSTPGPYYGAQIVWNGLGWNLTLRDGTEYVFGENAPLQAIRDRNGNQVTLTRTNGQSGNITQVTSPNGRWIQFTYDAGNRVTQAADNLGRTVSYSYDANGRLVQVTDAAGGGWKYAYDANNNMTSITDPRNITYLQNQYDSSNRITKQIQADTGTFQFSYVTASCINSCGGTGSGIVESDVTDPNNNIRKVTFNADGYVLTDAYAFGKPEQQSLTYTRDSSDRVLSVTDALNHTTSFTYDAVGNVTSITRLAGTPNAVTTSFAYGQTSFGQPTSVADPLGRTSTFAYNSLGNLTSFTDPLGNSTTFTYGSYGELATATDPLGNTTQFVWDNGNLVSVSDPLGRTTSQFYDPAGRLATFANPLGQTTKFAYNNLNQLSSITDPLSGVTSFTYDPNGNLLSVTDPKNNLNPTNYTYDSMDRLATRKDPLGNIESYQYDKNGNLTQFTDRRGKVTTYTYDALDRLTFAGFGALPGPTYESTISYSYDAGNRLTQAVDSITGTISRTYDGLDRLLSEATPQGTVSYAYDAAGRRTSMTVAGQPAVNYSYDNASRPLQITQGANVISFSYDAAGRRTSLTLPDGIVTSYSYDTASELTGINYQLAGSTLGNLAYSYDVAGRRTQVGGSFARTGIPLPIGTTAYNAGNELTQWGTATLTYDANGNMLSSGSDGYTWDARNHLVSTLSGSSFKYDPFGRRVAKTISGATTSYLYDGLNPVQELSGTTVTANLMAGLTVDEFFNRADSAGARNFLTDALGSTLALADSTGALQTQYTYEPFGNTSVSGQASANSYKYTGRENDGTGLYFYRGRYYSPTFQRFASEDPIEFAGGFNLYAYVGNNPIGSADPFGLCPPTPQQRVRLAARGGLNLGIGIGKVAVGVGIIAGSEGLGTALGAYSIESGLVGNIGGGIGQLAGAINGNIEEGQQAGDVAAAVSSVSGLATLAATRGNIGAAATAAQIEGVGLTPLGAGLGQTPSIPDVLDSGQSAYDLLKRGSPKPDMARAKCPRSCPQ